MSLLNLPERTSKKRSHGLTSIQDVRLSIGEQENILKDFEPFVDIAKIGVGTAYVNPLIQEKIDLYHKSNVVTYFGGTLFEKFYYQNKIEDYLSFLDSKNVGWIEISNGTVDISLEERSNLIRKLAKNFNILAEVGCKDSNVTMTPSEWIQEISGLLDAGANYVITEGRDSGTAGIYDKTGAMRTDLISDIILEVDTERIIFEAPKSSDQMYLINHIGSNVNLGNVSPYDLLLLEAQRLGLRNETFFVPKEIGKN